MKHRRDPIAAAVRYALCATVAVGLTLPALAQAQDEEAAELERVEVTGSRIKRSDIEGALPVQVIDRETIELSGENSVADLLRNQPFNSAGSARPASGNTGQAYAGISLRALGEGRTLVLVDGRRQSVSPMLGEGNDLNTIPLGAVERIEILSDGASAIYGSDAIGGVVNIITRKDFTGAELMVGAGKPEQDGGDTETGSAVFGAAGAKGQIMAGASYDKRDIVYQRERDWSRGGFSTFSNNFLASPTSFMAHPEYGSGNAAGCDGEGFFVVGGEDTLGNNATRCYYDFTLQAADEAEVKNESIFARGKLFLNQDWSVFLNTSVTRVTSFGRYAPVPSSPWLVGSFGAIELPAGSPNHPGTAPEDGGLNPNWQDYQDPIVVTQYQRDEDGNIIEDENGDPLTEQVVQYSGPDQDLGLRHRFAANGPRDTTTDNTTYDYELGFEGLIGPLELQGGVRRVDSQFTEVGRNYIVSALAQPVFNSGDYNIYDPFATPEDVKSSFTATIGRDARYLTQEAYVYAGMDAFDGWGAGPIAVAFGAEYRDEDYYDKFDDLQANGNITGSAGNSSAGDRYAYAFFGEVLVPIIPDLEVSLAGRYDDYSDVGNEFSPKISARWQPLTQLTVRGSWGQGFRAPPLTYLASNPSFSADFVRDPQTCLSFGLPENCSTQVTTFVVANPSLIPETSDQYSFGVAFEPFNWLNGSVDYWNIKVDDRIAAISTQTIINCLAGTTSNCPPGLSELPGDLTSPAPELGLGIGRGADGGITVAQRGYASLGTIETDGVDANLRTQFDFGGFGSLSTEFLASYTLSYEVDSGEDIAGDVQFPNWRGILRNVYTWRDFSFAWNINYIDGQDGTLADADEDIPSWVTHDLQVNYFTPWDGRVTIGADNVGDKDPIVDFGEDRGFNVNLYDPYGRVVYARYTQSF